MFESRNISDLRPDVRANAEKFIEICAAHGLPVGIASTVRDQEKQTEYYKKGTGSKLVSFHSLGVGLAFDIFHKVTGYDDLSFFERCGEIGKTIGFEWGGDWTSPDRPHFQWSEGGKYSSSDILAGRVPKEMPRFTENRQPDRTYYVTDGVHILELPIKSFKLKWWDKSKRTIKIKNYFNASFFGNYKTLSGEAFTLPAGHVVADITPEDFSPEVLKELKAYGEIIDGKIRITFGSSFAGKSVTTLVVTNDKAYISPIKKLPTEAKYAVSGMPVMLDGKDVSWKNDVLTEGWDTSAVYATWHGFLGVKGDTIMYFAFNSKTSNCIQSSEAFNKLKGFGCTDILMLDGGGSFVLDIDGKNKAVTAGTRQINTVGMF